GELLAQFVANRSMNLAAGTAHTHAYLDIANPTGATSIILSIQKNGSEIGTITIAANSQNGTFSIPIAMNFAEGDRYGLRVTQSNSAVPSGLSVTLPFIRTDI